MTLGVWVRKAVECFKCCLMGHINRNMKNIGTEYDLNCGCLDQYISEEKKVNMWPRDLSCDILVKSMAAFSPCSKSLPEGFNYYY